MMLSLALRNLVRNRRRSVLTALSLVGGYLVMSLSLSLSGGTYDNVIKLFTGQQIGHVQISAQNYRQQQALGSTLDQPAQLLAVLDQHPRVAAASARLQASVLVQHDRQVLPAELLGVHFSREAAASGLDSKIKSGALPAASSSMLEVLVGQGIARQLDLSTGDQLVLSVPSQGAQRTAHPVHISGLIGTSDSPERMQVLLSLDAAQQLLGLEGQAHTILVQSSHYSQAEALARDLRSELDDDTLDIAPWQVVAEGFHRAMQADREGMTVMLAVVMLLVSLGVLNTVLMVTLERTREFGVMRALGTRGRRVFMLIQLETLLLVLLSCTVGALVAWPLNVFLAQTGFALPEPVEVAGITLAAMKGSFNLENFWKPALLLLVAAHLVALLPAWRSARLSPLMAMRSV